MPSWIKIGEQYINIDKCDVIILNEDDKPKDYNTISFYCKGKRYFLEIHDVQYFIKLKNYMHDRLII